MIKMLKEQKHYFPTGLSMIFFLSFFAVGMFYEYLSAVFGFLIACWIFLEIKKEKKLWIYFNSISFTVLIIVVFYGVSALWAVDSGMALFGFLKFLPVLLFLVCIMQKQKYVKEIKEYLPYFAAGITVISILCMHIPMLEKSFSVAGRLAGFFQYPNTFALFILVAELLLIRKEEMKKQDLISLVILLMGLLYTGSRTAFILAAISNVVLALMQKNKMRKMILIGGVVLIVGSIIIYALISGNADVLTRLMQLSINESTFAGRLLYFQDAFPLVLKHPFGLGYMGHYYMQQSIQTGVYSVLYIHNDFLQLLLDIGWIPFVCMVISIGQSLTSRTRPYYEKVILSAMVLHSLFDFNLQFVSMFCLMLLFMDVTSGKKIIWNKNLMMIQGASVGLMILCIYGGMIAGLVQLGKNETVHCFYPWHTQNEIQRLTKAQNAEEMNEIADGILKRNEYVTVAYSAKAKYAYATGDFESLIKYKNTIFEQAPFQYEEYEEYCYMLINGIYLYQQAEDLASVQICQKELRAVTERLENLSKKQSGLGKKIKDQPQTELPEEITEYIVGGVKGN